MRLMLEQKQMLKMVMTTELRQAIELLQLSSYELWQFIQQQVEENPFIEYIENEHDTTGYSRKSSVKQYTQQINPVDHTVKNEKTMYEQLLEQSAMLPLTKKEHCMMRFMILNINEQGFLPLTNEDIATELQLDEKEIEYVRGFLCKLEPLGIGSKDIKECLYVQSLQAFPSDGVVHMIIQNYLQELADKKWHIIANQLSVTLKEVQNSLEKIQMLNPRPAAEFVDVTIDYVTPDLTVEMDEQKKQYMVHLHDHFIPNLEFNRTYLHTLPESNEVASYVDRHYKNFQWLQRSIMQRRQTIMKIMNVMIRHQKDFLKHGLSALKPLTLKDIATEIDMHESTVSRATTNKIIQTPTGTYELKKLFSTKLKTTAGRDTSQTTVKEMIRDLVVKENKYKPLSDQQLANILLEKEIVISRRTVAKYRDELRILSSSKRKEFNL